MFPLEESETFQFYGFDSQEDLISIEPMSGHPKQPQFDMAVVGPNYAHPGTFNENASLSQYVNSAFPAEAANQTDLAALPPSFNLDFDANTAFPQEYDYATSRVDSLTSASHVSIATEADQAAPAMALDADLSSKKRKASVDFFSDDEHTSKKVALSLQDPSGEYRDISGEPSPYSSLVPTPNTAPVPSHRLSASPRIAGHQYSVSNASQTSFTAPPYTPTVSPAFTTANTDHSPCAPATPIPRPASTGSAFPGSNPKLVRTSTISQSSPPGLGPYASAQGQTQAFNPYTMYSPNAKARLTLDGDLNAIAKNWTAEEMEARRKIIVFTRSQKGNEIFAKFKTVPQKEWSRQPGTVNCIWWKERNDAYVTSVDTIQLLEELVHVRFTVEEKNRIRRNLEGFKPLTVSKAKPDSEEFFKVIMGFPNPKPRNIEKDVKVFPWRILPTALCKIISKYSASYASTASALTGAPAQLYRSLDIPAEFHYPASPNHDIRGPLSAGPVMQRFETEIPQGRMSAPVTPLAGLPVAPMVATQQYEMPQQFAFGQMPQHPAVSQAPYTHQTMSAPVAHGNPYWSFNLPTEGHMPMTPVSAPPTGYMPRGMIDTADFGMVHAANHVMHR